jgi:hypothetical protein
MEKKMYYRINNNDQGQIVDVDSLNDIIHGEAETYSESTNERDKPNWNITLVWMTEEEYENLPDAY